MPLSDVYFQTHAQTIVQRTVRADRVPHAYLFHGPDGVGKERFALGLAQLLLCPSPVESELESERATQVGLPNLREGCGRCDDCRAVAASTHPDVHLVYRQLVREHPDAEVRRLKALDLGVNVVRTFLIDPIGLTPQRGRKKLFIIREAERMTASAQNALLKTLEEPPGESVLILLATQPDRLLDTTRSRCQAVRFDPLPTDFIESRLSRAHVDLRAEETRWYARYASGSIGRGLEYASDDLFNLNGRLIAVLATPERTWYKTLPETWKSLAESLAACYAEREPDASDTESQRVAYQTIWRLTAQWFADVLHLLTGETSLVLNETWRAQLTVAASRLSISAVTKAIQRLAEAERQLGANVLLALCVESLVNDLVALAGRQTVTV